MPPDVIVRLCKIRISLQDQEVSKRDFSKMKTRQAT